jgi:hypothetical protein
MDQIGPTAGGGSSGNPRKESGVTLKKVAG